MKLSTKGRYAVMAMADLAHHSRGKPIALAEVAERQEISLSYLEQLFGRLRRGGLVSSVRGRLREEVGPVLPAVLCLTGRGQPRLVPADVA